MKALFLDRDGIINRRLPGYVRTPDEFELLESVLPILEHAHASGYVLLLASNQQGVGKGLMSALELRAVHDHMQRILSKRLGFTLDHAYYCTDLEGTSSKRRKPQPGMLLEGIQDFHLHPSLCWFLGDSLSDALAGKAAGVHTALVGAHAPDDADLVAPDLNAMHVLLTPVLR